MKELMLALLLAAPVSAQITVQVDPAAEEPAQPQSEVKHTVVKGDHLWGLSKHYYANPYKWRAIHNANPFIQDPHWIYPGQILTIPGADVAAATPDEPFPPAPASQLSTEQVKGITVTQPVAVPTAPVEPPIGPQQDSLSSEMPEQMSGGYPSMTRLKAPKNWKPDGEITGLEDREIMAAQGDVINGRIGGKAMKVGDKLWVLRKDAVEDGDVDKKAKYYVRVGTVEVRRRVTKALMGGDTYRLLILQSGDSLQAGDLLSRKPL